MSIAKWLFMIGLGIGYYDCIFNLFPIIAKRMNYDATVTFCLYLTFLYPVLLISMLAWKDKRSNEKVLYEVAIQRGEKPKKPASAIVFVLWEVIKVMFFPIVLVNSMCKSLIGDDEVKK